MPTAEYRARAWALLGSSRFLRNRGSLRHIVGSHVSAFARRGLCCYHELEHSLDSEAIENLLTPIPERVGDLNWNMVAAVASISASRRGRGG